ncbi:MULTISPECIES: transposase [Streptomyces]|nr:transposase [Streptomyces prasinus]
MNAHCERVIGILRREVLSHLPIQHETRARHALDAYARHCDRHRPHRARGRLPPLRSIRRPPPGYRSSALTRTRARPRRQRVPICGMTGSDGFPNGPGSERQVRLRVAVSSSARAGPGGVPSPNGRPPRSSR